MSGSTPQIGSNGNWFINNEDTGIAACCIQFSPAPTGPSPQTFIESDIRLKKDISVLDKVKDFFMSLNPVKYRFKNDDNESIHYGLIAQEVEKSMSENDIESDFAALAKVPDESDKGNFIYHLNYMEFISLLIKIVQEQQKEIDNLNEKFK
ncbi:MAG: tail fiber domain-containing protein [Lachnoclostridium sp.]|nr:tail fiber domain-containing protein [Lachnoclostridium sp.]